MIKKLMQLRNTIVALLGIEFVLVLLTYMFLQNRVTLALMIYILIKNVVCIIVLYYLHNMFSETTYSVKEALNNESKNALIFGGIGLIKYDENRNVVWVSDLLHELGIRIVGKKLLEWQPLLAILFEDEDVRTIDINSRKYEVYNSRNNRLLFLKDVTDLTTIEKEYNDQQLCVAYLTIDNYDDSIEYADEQKSVMIETTSRQMIFDWAKDNGIILKRYKEDGYLAVFNERIYRKQVEVRFCILDEFKQKMESIGAVMSLSMGIGRGSKVLRELDELAFSAISLSYSRGGDQVAVKTLDEEIRYFGGNSENSEKANRVRARVISQTLASIVKQSQNILIMGHKQSDLDSFGASLAVAKFAKAFEKDAYVIVDENSLEEKTGNIAKYFNNTTGVSNVFDNKTLILNRPAAWNKLYKKELFNDSNLRYVSNKWYEDLRLTSKLYLKCKKISFVEENLYYYLIRNNSIMNNKNLNRNYEIIEAFEDIIDYFKEQNYYDEFYDEINFLGIQHIYIAAAVRVILNSKNNEIRKNLDPLNDYFSQNFSLKSKYIYLLDKNKRIVYFLLKHKMYRLIKFIFRMKEKI